MKRYYAFSLYLETDVSGDALPEPKALAELIALEAMRCLPVKLLQGDGYAVRMEGAEITYRGHRIPAPGLSGSGRKRTAYRRPLPY